MSIAPTLQKYLAAENIQYEEIPHELSMTSTRTADACHISGDRLAKGIVLRRDGEYMLAVVPASHHLRLSELRTKLGDNVDMADETEINQLFRDCAHGAVPAVGKCYGWISSLTIASRHSRGSTWRPAITRRCFI
ncbi:MAG: aminoacyl-tRNA deacylase [Afipia sp.]